MKPTPNQMVDGMRALLRESVLPRIESDEATADARRIMVVLRDTDWNEFGFALLRENAALAGLAAQALEWSVAQVSRQAHFAPLRPTLHASQDGASRDDSFARAQQRNLELRKALADFVDQCPLGPDPPGFEGLEQLRARMASVLAEIAAAAPSRRQRAPEG